MDTDHARKLLTVERERLLELRRRGRASLAESLEDSTSELTSFDQHPGDVATETHERERDESLVENFDEQLAEVDAAFERIDAGTYGICEGTGERIPDERLEAMPTARYTVEHQQRLEREARAGTGRSDAVTPTPDTGSA